MSEKKCNIQDCKCVFHKKYILKHQKKELKQKDTKLLATQKKYFDAYDHSSYLNNEKVILKF